MERDDEVNKKLLFEGWTVIRFLWKYISKDVEGCVRVIEEAIWEKMIQEQDFNSDCEE